MDKPRIANRVKSILNVSNKTKSDKTIITHNRDCSKVQTIKDEFTILLKSIDVTLQIIKSQLDKQ